MTIISPVLVVPRLVEVSCLGLVGYLSVLRTANHFQLSFLLIVMSRGLLFLISLLLTEFHDSLRVLNGRRIAVGSVLAVLEGGSLDLAHQFCPFLS